MGIKKIIAGLLGLFCLGVSINSLLTGKISGIGKSPTADLVYKIDQPLYYWMMTLFMLCAGLILLYGVFKK